MKRSTHLLWKLLTYRKVRLENVKTFDRIPFIGSEFCGPPDRPWKVTRLAWAGLFS